MSITNVDKMAVPEITVAELNTVRENGDVILLDVRSQDEFEFANIGPDLLIPVGQLPARIGELDQFKEKRLVVMCRSGARSAQACAFLIGNGFSSVENLKGGIRAWSQLIDPNIPVY